MALSSNTTVKCDQVPSDESSNGNGAGLTSASFISGLRPNATKDLEYDTGIPQPTRCQPRRLGIEG